MHTLVVLNIQKRVKKKHIPIKEHEFISLAKALLNSGKTATIICESPATIKDTLKMRSIIERLKK